MIFDQQAPFLEGNPLFPIVISLLGLAIIILIAGIVVVWRMDKAKEALVSRIIQFTATAVAITLLSAIGFMIASIKPNVEYKMHYVYETIEQADEVYGIELSKAEALDLRPTTAGINFYDGERKDRLYGEIEYYVDGEISTIRLALRQGEFILIDGGKQEAPELDRVD